MFLSLFILSIHYCNAQHLYSEEQQKRYLPKKEKKFILSKELFTLSDTFFVSPKVVFVSSEFLCGQKCDYLFTYMRFFTDGKVFVSFPYLSYPNIQEFNDLTYGKYGRYVIKDGHIKIELYMNKQHGVMFMFAKPVLNGVQFYKTTGTGIGQILKVSKTTQGGFYRKIIL